MTILLRILVFLSALWFVLRFVGALLGKRMRQKPRHDIRNANPSQNTVRDPVCGMYMDPRLAIRLPTKGGEFYFCSEECRGKFLQKRMNS